MTISGFSRLALEVTLPRPGSGAQVALDRRGRLVQLLRIVARERELQLAAVADPPNDMRTPGMSRSAVGRRHLEFLQRHVALVARRQLDRQAGAPHVADRIAADRPDRRRLQPAPMML